MTLRGMTLEFDMVGGIAFPKDKHLLALVQEYAARELASAYNPTDYRKVLVACEVDDQGVPQKVHGLVSGGWAFDWSQLRFTDPAAGEVLIERMRSYMDDLGARGQKVFVHIADHEAKESRCPKWRSFLRKVGAVKASRWSVTV